MFNMKFKKKWIKSSATEKISSEFKSMNYEKPNFVVEHLKQPLRTKTVIFS